MERSLLVKGRTGVRALRSVVLSAAALVMSSLAYGQLNGTYSIDKNSAASSTNFQSFTSAVQALRGVTRSDGGPAIGSGGVSGPVVINVASNSGPYTEQITIPAISGATSTNTITFNGNNQTIQFSATSANRHIIHLNGADYIRLTNLIIKTTNTVYGWGIRLSNDASYNEIRNCDIDMSAASTTLYYNAYDNIAGIAFTNVDDRSYGFYATYQFYGGGGVTGKNNKIVGNQIHGRLNSYGMYVAVSINGDYGTYDNTYNNEVDSNEIYGFRYYGVQTYFAGGNKFRGNDIHRLGSTSSSTYYFYGIYNYYGTMDAINNKMHDPFPNGSNITAYFYGIYHYYYGGNGTKMYNNQMYRMHNVYGFYGIFAYYDGDVYHNTIDVRSPGSPAFLYGIYAYTASGQIVRVKNNSISFTTGATKYPLYYYQGATNTLESDNNNIYRNTGNFGTWNFGNITSFTNWKNTSGKDLNSSDNNPNYADPANGDLTPQVLELDGGGTPVGVSEDINGNARDLQNPDVGSIEFDIPINVNSVTFPTSICQGDVDDVEVSIENNSSIDLSNFKVVYTIDNVVQATETFTGTILAGQTANFTFAQKVTSNTLGNFELKAYVRGKSPVTTVNYSVNPSPIGSFLSKGSVFEGTFDVGTPDYPDIVAYGDELQYDIAPPTGYNNSDFGSTWTFDVWELSTGAGTSAGASHQTTNPGASDGMSSFTPVIGQSDSTYTLRYAIRSLSNGCIAPAIERTIFVAPRPVASFTSLPACEGQGVQFDNNTTISSGYVDYMWRFGDGDSTVLINPLHVYPGPGTYNVELVAVSNYGYEHVALGTAEVKENPTAEFSSTNTCEGAPVPFSDASIIPSGTPTYEWDFGDGSAMGSGNNPSHQYATPDVYKVTMKVTANGCSGEASHYVTYAPRAVVDFNMNQVSCNNETVLFSNATTLGSGKVGYSWDFENDGSSDASTANTSHEYSGFGTFDVKLTATTDFGCIDEVIKQVSLLEGPKADFTTSPLCDKDNVDFTNLSIEPGSGTTGYEWNFSDASTYSTKDVSRSFAMIGQYEVELIATNTNGCQDVLKRTISVDEMPVAQFYVEDVCLGNDVMIQNASTGNNGNFNYTWDLDAGQTSVDKNPVASYSTPGTYTINLTINTPSGCVDQISKTVNVNELPSATVAMFSGEKGDGTIGYTIGNITSNTNYTLLFGDGGNVKGNSGNQTSISGVYTYQSDAKYFYTLNLNKAGCLATTTGSIDVLRTSTGKLVEMGIRVFPNPSAGIFFVDVAAVKADVQSIEVYSVDGKRIISIDNQLVEDVNTVNLSTLTSGVYLIKIITKNEVYSSKVTLNK